MKLFINKVFQLSQKLTPFRFVFQMQVITRALSHPPTLCILSVADWFTGGRF